MCDLRAQSTCRCTYKYMRTLLMTKFMSHALYADPHIHVKTEVHFGLKSCITVSVVQLKIFFGD